MQETLRQRNWKGQAVGLEHRDWVMGGGGEAKCIHTSKIDAATSTHQKPYEIVQGRALSRSCARPSPACTVLPLSPHTDSVWEVPAIVSP